jgi:LacI family transcriptional regulator
VKQFPKRESLVVQTAEILREQISVGTWADALPGERDLAQKLHVSRPTVRAALEQLRREGRIDVAQGQRRRIRGGAKGKTTRATTRAMLLTPSPMHRMSPFVMLWVDELRQHLSDEGFAFDVLVSNAGSLSRPDGALERLTRQFPKTVWILLLSTEAMQRWFVRHELPCVVAGSCFSDVQLPAVDLDLEAVCRHAAGTFQAKGHRHLALLLPESGAAGDVASEKGFLSGVRLHQEGTARVFRHNETTAGIKSKLQAMLASHPKPTALLVGRTLPTLTAFSYLLNDGRRIPRDIALVARDSDEFLEHLVPVVARYSANPQRFCRSVAKMVLLVAQGGLTIARQKWIMPDFIKGETI